MVNVLAKIRLYVGVRKTPFKSGYRPLFNFIPEMKTSGQISFINDRTSFSPGEEGIVKILFGNEQYLGNDFGIGKKFTFGEGGTNIGEGEIIDIYN